MSVIYGIFHINGQQVEDRETTLLLDSLSKVKYDHSTLLKKENVALGTLCREIVRHPSERGAFYDSVSGMTICADVRLDNREELAEKLSIAKDELSDYADSLLLLTAYQKWGESSPEYLLGDFTFVVYDEKSKRMFCARDHMGIRPFYYYSLKGTFSFSTLRPPLMSSCPVAPTPNDIFIVEAFVKSHERVSETVANEILRLPPGHFMTVDENSCNVNCYWKPEPGKTLKLSGDKEYAEALREVFTKSVRSRVKCDWRVGSHLSSGLDSTAITILAARELRKEGKRPLAFSWSPRPETFDRALGDERDLILEVIRQENLECLFSDLKPQEIPRFIKEHIYAWGDYSRNLFEINHFPAIADNNCRIMLSGWGGDALTSYDCVNYYFSDILMKKGIFYLIAEMVRHRMSGSYTIKKAFKNMVYSFLPHSSFSRWLFKPRHRLFGPHVNRNLLEMVSPESQKRNRRRFYSVKEYQCDYILDGGLQSRTEACAEMGEEHGYNYLFPVLDKRVIEFMLSVPVEQLSRHGWRRYLFRNAMEGVLPPSVQWNKSKYESAYTSTILAGRSVDQDHVDELIQEINKLPVYQQYFDPKGVEELLTQSEDAQEKIKALRKIYAFTKFLDNSFCKKNNH